ncbi:DUF5681 domain-containing protein [Sphingomonas bacterium]|uniref:DUF5681 domain-containing protein n=1 Tax=Sphingomonas bacterium TaxID=1895847 RepID=UPI0015762091|nr:DUF5681 domain-containing protein [Sphingomonas bacterium]
MTTHSYPSPRPRIRFIPTVPSTAASMPMPPGGGDDPRLVAEPGGVRRKRLPNKGSFPPHVSGNPKGRPKGAKGTKAIVRKILSAPVDVQTARGTRKIALFEALVKKEVALAAEGDWRARKTVFELSKWAMNDAADAPTQMTEASTAELTETGKSIIAWFEDEVTHRNQGAKD